MRQRIKAVRHKADIEGRFNRALVKRQIKASAEDGENIDELVDLVHKEWTDKSISPDKRPRFFKSDVFPKLILVSTFGTFEDREIQYEVFPITYRGDVIFGVPIAKAALTTLGGRDAVARMIALGGAVGLIAALEDVDPSINEFTLQVIDHLTTEFAI